jgi:hypothetical protein
MVAFLNSNTNNLYLPYQGWDLNFRARMTKNVSFEQKKIQLWNKKNFVGNKTEIVQHVLNMQ